MKLRVFISGLFLVSSFLVMGQKFNKNDFYEADMALVSGNYERAQKIVEKILRSDPENVNLNFLNGLCLINLQGRKKEALPYLQKTVQFTYSDYKYGDPQETFAPLEALKYYAMACKLNDDIQKAIEVFNQYKSSLNPKEEEEIALTDKLIEACYTAQTIKSSPMYFKTKVLGENIKSNELRIYPVVNNDETMLFYSVRGSYERDDIFYCQKTGETWGDPVNITALLGVKDVCYPSSVSYDNTRLYITVKSASGTDIYCSLFAKDKWQRMVKLDKPVNGSGWDSQASESSDGRYLYFSSDRKGGIGNMDLYRAEKNDDEGWNKPVNLGPVINTSENELMPVINADNTKLYFKSEGHENLGGYDLFVSQQTSDNEWAQPVNMGYPFNTTDDDIYSIPVRDGNFAYIARENPTNKNVNEIYLAELFSEQHPRQFEIAGLVSSKDNSAINNTTIEVISTNNYEKVLTAQPDISSGEYQFEIPGGSYMINYINPKYKTYTQLIDLPINYPDDALTINALMEKEVEVAEVVTPIEEPINKSYSVEAANTIPEQKSEVEYPDYQSVETTEPEPVSQPVLAGIEKTYSTQSVSKGVYTVQFMASLKNINLPPVLGKHQIEVQQGNDGYYRYITGIFNNPEEAEKTRDEIAKSKYSQAFIRIYDLDQYLNKVPNSIAPVYTIQIMAAQKEVDISGFKALNSPKISIGNDGVYRYTTGEFSNLATAQKELERIINKGFPDAYIKKINEVSNYR